MTWYERQGRSGPGGSALRRPEHRRDPPPLRAGAFVHREFQVWRIGQVLLADPDYGWRVAD